MEKELSYSGIHSWIRLNWSKSYKCENPDCKVAAPIRFEWALKKDRKYSKNRDDYMELCASCHRKYDETEERRTKISKALKGVPTKNNKPVVMVKISDGSEYPFRSVTEAAKQLNISRSTIQQVLSKMCKSVGGYICHYQNKNC